MASASPSEGQTPTPGMNLGVGNGMGRSPMMGTGQPSGFMPINGEVGRMGGEKDMADGPFDVMQDMGVDMSGWNFPDFWAFDLGGDF
jgi:hypothetical protein